MTDAPYIYAFAKTTMHVERTVPLDRPAFDEQRANTKNTTGEQSFTATCH
jgi:hypothetical protein